MPRRFTIRDLKASFMSQAPASGLAYTPKLMKQTAPAERTGKNKTPEADLQIACCQLLDLKYRHILWWATPNSTWVGDKTSGAKLNYLAKLKRMGQKRGMPDLNLLFRNRHGATTFCFAELKSAKGVVSNEQKSIMDRANGLGAFTAIVKSIEDLEALIAKAMG